MNSTIFVATTLISIIVILIIVMWLRNRRGRHSNNEEVRRIVHFAKSNPSRINPNISLENYEFPIERLRPGKKLGAGAYGIRTNIIRCKNILFCNCFRCRF